MTEENINDDCDINGLKQTLAILEMTGRKTIKISDVQYYLENPPPENE